MRLKPKIKVIALILLSAISFSLTAQAETSSGSSSTIPTQKGGSAVLDQLSNQLRSVEHEISDINGTLDDTGKKIEDLQDKAVSLQDQIDHFDEQIQTTQQLIENTTVQIGKKENQLLLLNKEIVQKKRDIDQQKNLLMEYINLLYQEELDTRDTAQKDQAISVIKLLLTNQSAGEELEQVQYFAVLEKTGHTLYDKLNNLLQDLEKKEKNYRSEQAKLVLLQQRLTEEKSTLETQREAKTKLLEETKGQESIYQDLLQQSKKDQLQLQLELKDLQSQYQLVKAGQNSSKATTNSDISAILKGNNKELYEYLMTDENTPFKPSWPVEPARGISALFHDSEYVKVFGVPHNAIDIPTPQSTPVHAPADGIVYKVRDNGYGYSYLILLHKGGYMTVYGHISEFKVKVGDKVSRGDVVALSGATPGTKGAGYMTTGPHLHMEMLKAGQHIDPLSYLPLTEIPEEKVPGQYKEQYVLEKKLFDLNQQFESTASVEESPDIAYPQSP